MSMEADNLEEMLAIGKIMNKNVKDTMEEDHKLQQCKCEVCDCPQDKSLDSICADCKTGVHRGERKDEK